jgi:two-component system phosphate regulon sensor histidine kinase PhoR
MPEDPTGKLPANPELERERLVSLINSMADGIIALDSAARVLVCNGAALNILDINIPITGQMFSHIIKLVDKNKQPIDVYQLVVNTKSAITNRDFLLQYQDGSTINVYVSISPVHLGFGKDGESGYVLLLHDITREKALEEERDEFISTVSHELRTPMTIAEGNISNAQIVLEKSGDLNVIKKALKEAHDQTLFLASMLNDLATLSRAERGKLALEVEDINAHDLIQGLETSYRPQAEAKGLQLHSEIDPSLETLKSSKLYVREILQNFVTNAIKYTQTGSVTITAHTKDNGIQFEVRDTGIGISQADQSKLFEKFFRSDDQRTRDQNGTGLGLYVTMKLARLVGAKINLQSELNKGSTFTVFIPNIQSTPSSHQPAPQQS